MTENHWHEDHTVDAIRYSIYTTLSPVECDILLQMRARVATKVAKDFQEKMERMYLSEWGLSPLDEQLPKPTVVSIHIMKEKNGTPTVFNYDGNRYVLDNRQQGGAGSNGQAGGRVTRVGGTKINTWTSGQASDIPVRQTKGQGEHSKGT